MNATANTLIARTMTEAQLLDNVIDAAQKLGWRVAHFRPAKTAQGWRTAVQGDGKGFPDLVLVNKRLGMLVFAELKSERGKVEDEQEAWLDALEEAHGDIYVWRPADWLDGSIQRLLEGGPWC